MSEGSGNCHSVRERVTPEFFSPQLLYHDLSVVLSIFCLATTDCVTFSGRYEGTSVHPSLRGHGQIKERVLCKPNSEPVSLMESQGQG